MVRRLKEYLDESLTTSKVMEVYLNKIKYKMYHGRLIEVVHEGVIFNNRQFLYKLSIKIYKNETPSF